MSFSGLVTQYLSQLFHVHTRKGQACFHSHFFIANLLGISHSVVLFCRPEYPFYCLFSFPIEFFTFWCKTDVLNYFHVVCPNMSRNKFLVVLTFRAARNVRATFTELRSTFVLPVSLSIRC